MPGVTKSTDGEPVIRYGAIKPNQMVFLGHKIEGCQFAANVREKIAERALKCAEKPSIVFDYDYRFVRLFHLFLIKVLSGTTVRHFAT